MTIDVGECRWCHRPAVQWLDCDGMQDLGLCRRHCTFGFAAAELHGAVQDFKWAIIEAFTDWVTRVGIAWRSWRRRRRDRG